MSSKQGEIFGNHSNWTDCWKGLNKDTKWHYCIIFYTCIKDENLIHLTNTTLNHFLFIGIKIKLLPKY
jgi:hypothetical protein